MPTARRVSDISDMSLTLKGEASTSIYLYNSDEGEEYATQTVKLIDMSQTVAQFPTKKIDAGTYSFPFEITLPSQLHPTLQTIHTPLMNLGDGGKSNAQLGYVVGVNLKLVKKNKAKSYDYTVPLLIKPKPPASISGEEFEKTIQITTCCCIDKGTVQLLGGVDKSTVASGDQMAVQFTVKNDSKVPVQQIRAKLMMRARWKAGMHRTGYSDCVQSVVLRPDAVLPGQHASGSSAFTIATNGRPLLNSLYMKTITITYELHIVAVTSGWYSSPRITIPMTALADPPQLTAAYAEVAGATAVAQPFVGAVSSNALAFVVDAEPIFEETEVVSDATQINHSFDGQTFPLTFQAQKDLHPPPWAEGLASIQTFCCPMPGPCLYCLCSQLTSSAADSAFEVVYDKKSGHLTKPSSCGQRLNIMGNAHKVGGQLQIFACGICPACDGNKGWDLTNDGKISVRGMSSLVVGLNHEGEKKGIILVNRDDKRAIVFTALLNPPVSGAPVSQEAMLY